MGKCKRLLIGIAESGVTNIRANEFDTDTRFQMVKEAGVFDYVEKSPLPPDLPTYQKAIERHGIPILAGCFYYTLNRDEPLLEWHLNVARDFGALVHNVQVMTHDASGRTVSDEEVADVYCQAVKLGERVDVTPCFEVHVNMWSEHFSRVDRVAEIVNGRGYEFNMTLDHSHVIFKIDNPQEQAVQNMHKDIEAGKLVLDPYKSGNVCANWIDSNFVRHAHARSAIPGGPTNLWASHPDGTPGRGIQYPFVEPGPGEWHSEWNEEAMEPWKEVIRLLFRHHATSKESKLETLTTEFVSAPDYGGGAKYSIFEHSVACAEWIRSEWEIAQKASVKTKLSNA